MAAPSVSRVDVTREAADLVRRLTAEHGSLMFHQSGGCCDGSSPLCFPLGEFITGDSDVHLGGLSIEGILAKVPVWMSKSQFEYWKHTHLTIDVVKGRGAGFSLEAPEGFRFLIRSRIFTEDEHRRLESLDETAPRSGKAGGEKVAISEPQGPRRNR